MNNTTTPLSNIAPETYELFNKRLAAVRQWRQEEWNAGQQTDLDQFFRSHGLCFDCKSTGIDLSPVWWSGDMPLFVPCPRCGGSGKADASRPASRPQ